MSSLYLKSFEWCWYLDVAFDVCVFYVIIFCVDSSLTPLSLLPQELHWSFCVLVLIRSQGWREVTYFLNWRTCILPMLTCLSRRNKTQLSSPDWYRLVLMWTLFQSCSIWVTTLVNTLFGNMSVLSFNLLNHLTVVLNWHYDIYTKFIGNFILFFVSTSFTAHM